MKQVCFNARLSRSISVVVLISLTCLACGRLPRSKVAHLEIRPPDAPFTININNASAREMEQLPGVGKVTAERIVAYREQYGRFRRAEELLMVNGLSDKKFRAIQSMIVVE
jgi:competence ComEA-like helix-hairpin-helix protein